MNIRLKSDLINIGHKSIYTHSISLNQKLIRNVHVEDHRRQIIRIKQPEMILSS